MTQLAVKQEFSLLPTTFEQAEKYAQMIARSSFCPPSFKGNAGDVLIAVQMGNELGLKPLQALQNIAVINGKPSIYGDAMLALVQQHPAYEWIREITEDDKATCTIKRVGEPEHTVVFTLADAKRAGLLEKAGPWKTYPKRMLQMRARGFALRDKFPDALKGFISAEEAQDYPASRKSKEKYMGDAQVIETAANNDVIIEATPSKDFKKIEKKIKAAQTLEELQELVSECEALNKDEKEEIRKVYGKRSFTLKNVANQDADLDAAMEKKPMAVNEDEWTNADDNSATGETN